VSHALAAAGLSVNAAAKELKRRRFASISQSALNTVARGRTATTRQSVRLGLARLVGAALGTGVSFFSEEQLDAYLAGFGPDLSAPDLVRLRLAARLWDEDWNAVSALAEYAVARVKGGNHPATPLPRNVGERKLQALATVLDVERWKALLGDPRAQASDEDKTEFARLMGAAISLATQLPIPDDAGPENRRRNLSGLERLAHFLQGNNE
jgi:hypothetical protein